MLWAFLACGGGTAGRTGDRPLPKVGELAAEDQYVPTYGKPEIQRALIKERAAEASGERHVAELESKPGVDDRLRVAIADLAIRRRFIKALEACESQGRYCPPRVDDPPFSYEIDGDQFAVPPLESPLRFDEASWRTIATELHGRACACRTLSCIDSVSVVINRLEKRPMPEVQGDEAASVSITRARECLSRLRGRSSPIRPPALE
jgi:hypothetical protein